MKNYMQANSFLQKYGSDAFKIIAAYEEAADIPQLLYRRHELLWS